MLYSNNKQKALVIGGSRGIGLAISLELAQKCESVHVVDRNKPEVALPDNVRYTQCNLLNSDPFSIDGFDEVDILIITAGFGRIAPFETFEQKEIENVFKVNSIALTKVIHHFFPKMLGDRPFYCAVMGSIAGMISSPMISLYSASKAAVFRLIEGLNIELEAAGSSNRILDVSPGSIAGTRFTGAKNSDLSKTEKLASEIVEHMFCRDTLFIPEYESIFKGVIQRYHDDPHKFGMDSCKYKIESGRLNRKPQMVVGYLSGTFDLFHIGHLNILKRAKEHCDYLVVGVHKDASHKDKQTFIPFEERCEILRNIKFVDKVIQSEPEDDAIWKKDIVKYDILFVGSDYKGSERFNRYEEFFKDKNVEIIYFPYTQGTSSTKLRNALDAVSEHK